MDPQRLVAGLGPMLVGLLFVLASEGYRRSTARDGEPPLGNFGYANVARGRRMSIAIGLVCVLCGLLNFSGVLFTNH